MFRAAIRAAGQLGRGLQAQQQGTSTALASSRLTFLRFAASQSVISDEMRKRIEDMIKKDEVVVFMKGTKEEPMCGFSRNVKLVLEFHKVPFKVYVKGEFVGGCDILVQMHQDGEISDFLDAKGIPNKFGEKKPAAPTPKS